ncbi:hypothetical protein BDD12DRAFT_888500 [Trichophaea hybrida]|nr:hypothetical protein BDD12DRAFT_888500 [Trichophaea hybrida]
MWLCISWHRRILTSPTYTTDTITIITNRHHQPPPSFNTTYVVALIYHPRLSAAFIKSRRSIPLAPRQSELTLNLGYRQITLPLHRAFSLTIPNITPAIASSLALSHGEHVSFRYNAVTRRLTVSTISGAHNSAQTFITTVLAAIVTSGFVPASHVVENDNSLPWLVVEAGFSEEYERLLEGKDVWIVRGGRRVGTGLVVKIDETCSPIPVGREAQRRVFLMQEVQAVNIQSDGNEGSDSELEFF